VLLDQVGQLEQQNTTVSGRQLLPRRVLQSLAGGLDGDINILLAGSVD